MNWRRIATEALSENAQLYEDLADLRALFFRTDLSTQERQEQCEEVFGRAKLRDEAAAALAEPGS